MKTHVSIRWMTNACFEIRSCDTVIVTDPGITQTAYKGFNASSFKKVDNIILSHLHWDHVTELPEIEQKFHPNIFTGVQGSMLLADWLDCNTTTLYPMYPNQELDMGNFSIRCLYNRHTNLKSTHSQIIERIAGYPFMKNFSGLQSLQGIGGMEMNNYLITFENNFKILFWGGDIGPNQVTMLKGLNPDVALMQYSKQSPEALVELAEAINPKVLMPHHHDTRSLFEESIPRMELFASMYKGTFMYPENGKWVDFS